MLLHDLADLCFQPCSLLGLQAFWAVSLPGDGRLVLGFVVPEDLVGEPVSDHFVPVAIPAVWETDVDTDVRQFPMEDREDLVEIDARWNLIEAALTLVHGEVSGDCHLRVGVLDHRERPSTTNE